MDPMPFHLCLNAWNKPQSKPQHAFRSSIRTDSNGIAYSKWLRRIPRYSTHTVRRGEIKEIVRYVINIYYSNRWKRNKLDTYLLAWSIIEQETQKLIEDDPFLCKVKLPLSRINGGANPLKLCRYESEMRNDARIQLMILISRKIIKPMVVCLGLRTFVFRIENTLDRLILNNFSGY